MRLLFVGLSLAMGIGVNYSITHAGVIGCDRGSSFDWEAGFAGGLRLIFGDLKSIRGREWLLACGERLTITFDHRLR